VPTQLASTAAWQDEDHVVENRRAYTEKFDAVIEILGSVLPVTKPDASFYLWVKTPIAGEDFTQQLFAQQKVTVLPGSYLARSANGFNPGEDYVRMALVAPLGECVAAAQRIKAFVQSL
jgi:N-succinyldiaminopimelate aminotransferase